MLSRLSCRNIPSQVKALAACGSQCVSSIPADAPRVKRPIDPPPVRMGFIPDEWFRFFYPKTGVSGPYVFLGSLSTYLLSKEWYVVEHEFCTGISLLTIILYVHYKFGDKIAAYLDKEVDKYEEELNSSKVEALQSCEDMIKELEKEKWSTEGQLLVIDAKKQNVLMQLEANYRERLATVYAEVKRRLDYLSQINNVERRISQKHMVTWITNSVLKAITPDQEKANLLQCIKDLEALSKA